MKEGRISMEKDLVEMYNQALEARGQAIALYRLAGKVINNSDAGEVRQPEYIAAKKLREAIRPYMMDMLDAELTLLDGEMVGHYLRKE